MQSIGCGIQRPLTRSIVDALCHKSHREILDSNDLAPFQRYELSNIVQGCREVLQDLGSKLDKYRSLGSKSPMDRFRWAANDIAPIRTRLMHNALYLSTFNMTLATYVKDYRTIYLKLTSHIVFRITNVMSFLKRPSLNHKQKSYKS